MLFIYFIFVPGEAIEWSYVWKNSIINIFNQLLVLLSEAVYI